MVHEGGNLQLRADETPVAFCVLDTTGTITHASDPELELLGYHQHDYVGRNFLEFDVDPDAAELTLSRVLAGEDVLDHSARLRARDGSVRHTLRSLSPIRLSGVIRGIRCVTRDITEATMVAEVLQHAERHLAALQKENEVLRARLDDLERTNPAPARAAAHSLATILEATPDLVATFAMDGRVIYANSALRHFAGIASVERLRDEPVSFFDFVAAGQGHDLTAKLRSQLREGRTWTGEIRAPRHDGEVVPLSCVITPHLGAEGEIELVSGIARDVSTYKQLESELAYQATHDSLTELPNRKLLTRFLDRILATPGSDRTMVILFCDIDNFKVVNDSLGHSAGDKLLAGVAKRLREIVRPADVVARFGGDEFVVVTEGVDPVAHALRMASQISRAMALPFDLGATGTHVTVSTGIAIAAGGDDSAESLLRDADLAMYKAKELGRNRAVLFDEALRALVEDRHETESALHMALDRDEFVLHYQPAVDISTGRVRGFEALIRWNRPGAGLVPPSQFVRIAEQSDLIGRLGRWVIRRACEQMAAWDRIAPGLDFEIAVNLSGRQLTTTSIVDEVGASLDLSGLDPSRMVLELTESVLVESLDTALDTLRALKALGVRLAVDDFGTGYSSLTHLQRFPIDILKIDQSFVAELETIEAESSLAAVMTGLARTMGLEVIAEGVESGVQLEALRQLGCHGAQGFLFAPPEPPSRSRRRLGSLLGL
ncbi:MAG: hypothetical protein JJLCMIEE_02614 [Acidimicrobiales bacterium]|nr:MAG: bifunctional diguanylate cyclase/phosphodiesterase [Actinomycetota bacterium]MBV6509521.1 hypothetical protein [Acidimicrobiales bacterium]RIK06608.1 MAG: hypothetical protein DCC48_06790 [Acidobacteriota bacterium]